MQDTELICRVRNMIANDVMASIFDDTYALVAKYGKSGATDLMMWRLKLIHDMRDELEEKEGDLIGDKLPI